jgi:hypothetical protein
MLCVARVMPASLGSRISQQRLNACRPSFVALLYVGDWRVAEVAPVVYIHIWLGVFSLTKRWLWCSCTCSRLRQLAMCQLAGAVLQLTAVHGAAAVVGPLKQYTRHQQQSACRATSTACESQRVHARVGCLQESRRVRGCNVCYPIQTYMFECHPRAYSTVEGIFCVAVRIQC